MLSHSPYNTVLNYLNETVPMIGLNIRVISNKTGTCPIDHNFADRFYLELSEEL